MRATTYALSLLGATALAVVTPCAAQVEIMPFVGTYQPSAPLSQWVGCPPGELCGGNRTVTSTQQSSGSFGLGVTVWTSSRVGLALSLRRSESSQSGGFFSTQAFPVTMGSVGITVRFPIAATHLPSLTLGLGGGRGVVGRGGAVFQSAGVGPAQTDLGPAVGVSLRVPLAQRVSVGFDVEDFIYSFEAYPGIGPAAPGHNYIFTSMAQNDLVISAGLAMSLGGGRS